MLIRIVLIVGLCATIGAAVYFATSNAHGELPPSEKVENTSKPKTVELQIAALSRQVAELKAENESLRSEMATLTAQNGVIDGIISHLRELKAQDQAIIGLLQPGAGNYAMGGDAEGAIPAEGAVIGTAKHQIVTPKIEPTPVPTPRPEKVAEAPAGSEARDATATQ